MAPNVVPWNFWKSTSEAWRDPWPTATALALLITAILALGLTLVQVRASFTWVAHTNEVIRTIGGLQRALLEAESAERGYLLTGDESYRESYSKSRVKIPPLLDTLQKLVSDNSEQSHRAGVLRTSLDARLAELAQAVALGPARLQEALTILQAAHENRLTPQIEEQLDEFRRIELSLLASRRESLDRVADLETVAAGFLIVLALTSAIAGAILLSRQRTMSQLRAANDDLTRSREALKSREAHLEAILATVPDAMVVINDAGVIQTLGTSAEQLFGYTAQEAEGRNVSMLMPEPYQHDHDDYLKRYLTTGERRIIGIGRVVVGRRKDGSTFPMELSVGEVLLPTGRHFVGFVRDMTQRQESERLLHEMQSELLHVSRLSTMGEMASVLAHELNQPLAAMTNYIQGSKRLLEKIADERSGSVRDALDKAIEQSLRAGQVIRRMRTFIARGESEKRAESLKSLVEEASALALLTSKQQPIKLVMKFDPTVDVVLVDKVQIQQVLLNLMRNAIEAMQTATRRDLDVTTSPDHHNMVTVTVVDTGGGISPQVMAKLFQPFTTTKADGMGIGLSISRTIIESHGGEIWAESNPAGGTIFRFTLRRGDRQE